MKYILTFLHFILATTSIPSSTKADEDASPLTHFQISPPSAEFCASNILGDDFYFSFFKPCVFKFFDDAAAPDHFSCSDALNAQTAIQTEYRKVAEWPDPCVVLGPRCYYIPSHPSLSNYTIFNDTEFSMVFPSGATVVSVDCTADWEEVEVVAEEWPEVLKYLTDSVVVVSIITFSIVIGACVCCVWCCCFRDGDDGGRYQVVNNGVPVVATRSVAKVGPSYQAVL